MAKETILVVDDTRELADFVAFRLLPRIGYDALVAYDGKSTLKLLQTAQPALILMDLELPDTNGLDLLREIQKAGINIPTILVTAHGSERVVVDAFRLGVEDYLIKPVDADLLEKAIARALTEHRLRQETIRLNAQLQEQVSWLNALSKVGQSITSTLELNDVLGRIVEAGIQLTQAEEGFLALLEAPSKQLYIRAAKYNLDDGVTTLNQLVEDALVSRVINSRQTLRLPGQAETEPIKITTGLLVHGLIYTPILFRNRPLGVLAVYNRITNRHFLPKDEVLLTSLADYAAVAIENAGLYEKAQHELTERKRAEKALRESEERYALAVEGAADGIWDWNLRTQKIYYSPRWKAMLGYSDSEIGDDPKEWFDRVHGEDVDKLKLAISNHIQGLALHFESEHRVLHKDGFYRWVLSRGLAVRDAKGNATRIAGSQSDISDRKTAEDKLMHDAMYDGLTGLPNRQLLLDRLKSAIERARRQEKNLFAVLFLDLDQFKNINDSLGHPVGNQLLVAIGKLLQSSLRATDTVARLGGDEFVILLEGLRDTGDAIAVSEWILRKLRNPISLEEHEVVVSTSIGVVFSTYDYDQSEDMLRDADIAMYAAKGRGKATYAIFEPSMRERILSRLKLETDLRQVVKLQQIVPYYQPIIALENGVIVGMEALARWRHPERGLILPADFLPLAEDTGIITQIDLYMVEEACRQMYEWQTMFPQMAGLKIHLNLNRSMLNWHDLPSEIQNILKLTALNVNDLVIDISENSLLEYAAAEDSIILELGKLGCAIHIDDFEAGHSALFHLKSFPASAIKISPPFVHQYGEQNETLEVAKALVRLAKKTGVETVAEGIETTEQLRQFRTIGCKYGQGFGIAHPMEAQAATELLANLARGGTLPVKRSS